METLGDLVARERRSADPALVAPAANRTYDYRRFCTTAWKTGNFLRHLGVSEGATVAVAPTADPEAVLAFFGAALLGAETAFVEPTDIDARVAVAPVDRVGEFDLPQGGQRVGYGGPPDDPVVRHFERDVWSENPAFPVTPVSADADALVAADGTFTHRDLLDAAESVVGAWDLSVGDEVAVRASLADREAVVGGVVAPLLAGAAVRLAGEGEGEDATVVVAAPADVPSGE